MTLEDKMSCLKDLFAQREVIDQEIKKLIGGNAETPKTAKPEKRKYKRKDKPVKEDKKTKYLCQDCASIFKSKDSKLNAVCPFCKSIHVEHANRANK